MSIRVAWSTVALERKLRAAKRKAEEAGAKKILKVANETVPDDGVGALKDSGRVDVDEDGAIVSYNVRYAVKQHEDLAYHHQGSGRAKWLEQTGAELGSEGQIKEVAGEAFKAVF